MGIIAILLTGLKIICLILLGLLFVLLIILLLFLFVPFVYRLKMKYEDERFELNGEVNFMFKFIKAKFGYTDKIYYDFKAGFFTIASTENEVKKKDKKITEKEVKKETKKEEKQKENKDAEIKKESVNSGEKSKKKSEEKIREDIKSDTKIQTEENVAEEKKTDESQSERNSEEVKAELKADKKKVKKKRINIISKIKNKIEDIKAKWKAFKEGFKNINIKKDAVIKFLNADGTLDGAVYLFSQGKRFIKMIFPKKIKGKLKFGTGDVYTEGQYLSYLCLLYPLYAGKFEIEPEWEKEVIEINAVFSGRITMFVILSILLKVLFSRKVKLLRMNFSRCKKSFARS